LTKYILWCILKKEVSQMPMTRPFMSGHSQAIRIPKEYRLPDEDVFVNQIGNTITLTPRSMLWDSFEHGLQRFTDDFMAEGRPEEIESRRIEF